MTYTKIEVYLNVVSLKERRADTSSYRFLYKLEWKRNLSVHGNTQLSCTISTQMQ